VFSSARSTCVIQHSTAASMPEAISAATAEMKSSVITEVVNYLSAFLTSNAQEKSRRGKQREVFSSPPASADDG